MITEKYNIKSISLNLKNADVTIYGNSNKSYIEIVNFSKLAKNSL